MGTFDLREFLVAIWMTLLIRGLICVAFGLFAFAYPNVTLGFLVTVFGLYTIIDGVFTVWGVFQRTGHSMSVILHGLVGLLIGLFCLLLPNVAATYVTLLLGLWIIAAGILQVVGIVVLRNDIGGAPSLALGGVLSVLLGLLIVLYPEGGSLSIIGIIGGAAVFVGGVFILFALKLRRAGLVLLH